MNNKKTLVNVIFYAIAFSVYNIIAFAVPFVREGVFWTAYVFGLVAIVSQIAFSVLAFCGTQSIKEKLYAHPVSVFGTVYAIIQLIISFVLFFVPFFTDEFPTWIVWVICPILLGVFIVLVFATDSARDTVNKIDEETERQTIQVKTFRVSVDSILRRVQDRELYALVSKLSDIAKYSDPVSNESLYDIEAEITDKITSIIACVNSGDVQNAKIFTQQAIDLFEDRNALCKMTKR